MKKIVSFSIFFFLFLFSSCNSQIRHGSIQVSNIKFLNDKESTTIPFERYKGWIVLKVKVNDVKVFSFLLDTGAPIAVFGEGVTTNDLNLNITGQVAVRGEGNGSQKEVPFATNVKFTLGDVEINNASTDLAGRA